MSAEAVRAPAATDAAVPRFFDRELSWVEFNARVLELARDESVPLLERLRFVAIFSSNLDEFFQVRVAGMLETSQTQPLRVRGPGEPTLRELLDRVGVRVSELLDTQRTVLRSEILPALAEAGIRIVGLEDCDAAERRRLEATFHRTILPVLTPLAVGPGRPFPYISNLSLSLGVYVRDPESGQRRFARVKVPEVLPRFLEVSEGSMRFVPIEQLMAAHLGALFPGMTIEEQATFRVTRDADLEIEGDADDLLRAVENELRRRRFGDVVRLEVDSSISAAMRDQLVHALKVDRRFVYAPDSLIDHADLAQLAGLDRPELRYAPWKGVTQQRLRPPQRGDDSDVFAAMREGDILVHHPYDAFATSVERMIAQAVDDPDVVAIKHTIYRTSGDSPIVPSLIRAAEQGKQAVALVELKARFDEETNIGWARALERAGVHVVYGFADLKTHAKLALIVRREGDHMRRYAHVGTGNYHPTTARLYTDFGLFTTRPDITADVASLFNYLTGFSRLRSYRKLMVAPIDLRDRILAEISKVVEAHEEGKASRIQMKMNALVDRRVIDALYEASQAGVRCRPDRARDLLPATRRARAVRGHPGRLDHRALPGARPAVRVPLGRRLPLLPGLRRHDAPKPGRPGRGHGSGRGPLAAAGARRGHRAVAEARRLRLGHRAGRRVDAPRGAVGRLHPVGAGRPHGARPRALEGRGAAGRRAAGGRGAGRQAGAAAAGLGHSAAVGAAGAQDRPPARPAATRFSPRRGRRPSRPGTPGRRSARRRPSGRCSTATAGRRWSGRGSRR